MSVSDRDFAQRFCRGAMIAWMAAVALAVGDFAIGEEPASVAPLKTLPPMEALAKAQVGGKYDKLLRQFKVEDDAAFYGEFRDWGRYTGSSYRGFHDLPTGYWVWVNPHWYIWGENKEIAQAPKAAGPKLKPGGEAAVAAPELFEAKGLEPLEDAVPAPPVLAGGELFEGPFVPMIDAGPRLGRSWGPEQAVGPPNTPTAGDQTTAWASSTQDGSEEWLELEYAKAIEPKKVLVHETYNPGALVKVVAYSEGGMDSEIWSGRDPIMPVGGKGIAEIPFKAAMKTNKIRIYLDSKAVAGWNEIDAVGLIDSMGDTHWAVKATASSTYAAGRPDAELLFIEGPFEGGKPAAVELGGIVIRPIEPEVPPEPAFPMPVEDPRDARIKELEGAVKKLQIQLEEIQRRFEIGSP